MNTEQKWWQRDISGELGLVAQLIMVTAVFVGAGMLIGWLLAFVIPRLLIVFG